MRLSDIAVMIDAALARDLPPPLAELCNGLAVELGVEKGRGSAAIASGNPRLKVIGLDHTPREEWDGLHRQFPNLRCYKRASMPVPQEVINAGLRISLLHVDTEHSFAMAQAEFKAYQLYLTSPA